MGTSKTRRFSELVRGNRYPGRGIVAGESENGTSAVIAYFIMGRSDNSRNRIFVIRDGSLYTEPFDAARLKDPSLIIYPAVRMADGHLVVTNGDQTDTIIEGFANGRSFYESLRTRRFEPDAPNLTPRISAELVFGRGYADGTEQGEGFIYRMSILKAADPAGTACNRFGFEYGPLPGTGHFIHTYEHDGDPLPSFTGEPRCIRIPDSIDELTEEIWDSLDEENRISLYVRYTDIASGTYEDRLINKNVK